MIVRKIKGEALQIPNKIGTFQAVFEKYRIIKINGGWIFRYIEILHVSDAHKMIFNT